MFYFLLLTEAVYISLPTENKYLDGTSTFFLRAGELSMADSIDFYPTKDNYKKIKLNLRGTKDFLTVNNNSKILEIEEFNNEDNQNFELIIDVSGYIRIMYRSLCVEYMERKNYLLLRRCSRSAKQLFDLIAEKSVNVPSKSQKRSAKTLSRFMNRELLTTNFGLIMGKKKSKVLDYIDIEASEATSSEYSEDLGPDYTEWEDMGSDKKSLSEEEESLSKSQSESVESQPKQRDRPMNYLPNIYSPKLFLVRVPPGKEYIYFLRISALKNILSVIYKEELKGYLYVEALNKRVLQENLKSRHVSLIPQNEMTDVFFYKTSFEKYGRIKSGKYKGDICEILSRLNDEIIKIRLVPRLDGKRELFDSTKYPYVKSHGYLVYKKDSYKNGFLEKEVLARNVIPVSKIPLEDLEIFEPKKLLKNSQKVKVIKGEFKNEEGMVLRVESDGVLVDLTNFGRQFLEFSMLQPIEEKELDFSVFKEEKKKSEKDILRKRRDPLINKEVTIKKGEFKGYKGIVTHTYRDKVRILINTNNKDINLDREDIIVDEDLGPTIPHKEFIETGFRTPGAEFRTPSYKTPGAEFRTPNIRTPGLEFKTPGYKTPGYKTPGYKTPGYKTPGLEFKTPSYRTPGFDYSKNQQNILEKDTKKENASSTTGLFKDVLIQVDNKIKEIVDSNNDEFICADGRYKKSLVKFVSPEKYDTVCFMVGENKGQHGLLVAITGDDCVVRLHEKPINCKINEISRVANK